MSPVLQVSGVSGALMGVGDDFRRYGDGRLFGRVGAEVEADRGGQAGRMQLWDAGLPRELQALSVGAAGAHRAPVGEWAKRPAQRGEAERGVVGKDPKTGWASQTVTQ